MLAGLCNMEATIPLPTLVAAFCLSGVNTLASIIHLLSENLPLDTEVSRQQLLFLSAIVSCATCAVLVLGIESSSHGYLFNKILLMCFAFALIAFMHLEVLQTIPKEPHRNVRLIRVARQTTGRRNISLTISYIVSELLVRRLSGLSRHLC
jgi:hypothetical protein